MDFEQNQPVLPCSLRPQSALEGMESDSDSYSPRTRQRIFITHIRATNVVSGLRRIPAYLHVKVETAGNTTSTSDTPVLVDRSGAEWDEDILLPSERLISITFKIYASFELGAKPGNGVLLCRFKTTVGNVIERDEELQPIWFLVQKDEDSLTCPSLRIIAKRRIWGINEPAVVLPLSVPDSMIRVAQLRDIGHRALLRYHQLQNQKDLEGAITYFERARDVCPPDNANHSAVLFDLATAKFVHCQDNCHYHDLSVPITLYCDALQLGSRNQLGLCVTALELCFALLAHLQRQGTEVDQTRVDQTKSKNLIHGAVKGYAYRMAWAALQMSGISVSNKMIRPGISPLPQTNLDMEALIRKLKATLVNLSHKDPRRPEVLANLGCLLYHRFGSSGDLINLHEAVAMLENAIQLAPNDPAKPTWLNELGHTLCSRFECLGDLKDISRSILVLEEAICLTPTSHPCRPAELNNLGNSLARRFERLGDFADLNKSISALEQALDLTPDHDHYKASRLNNLAHSLFRRFQCLDSLADINKSISILEQAIHLTPNGHPDMPGQLSNLGSSLYRRFERLGDLADINNSILMGEEAVRLAPSDHPEKPSWLSHLGTSLSYRFQRLGDLADINKSISTLEKAIRLTPRDHPSKQKRLELLSVSLDHRFEHLGDDADLNRAIAAIEEAVKLTPNDHPDKPAKLNNLGSSLLRRFQRLGDAADVDLSISLREEAVRLTSSDHPDKRVWLNGLGGSFLTRFERFGNIADITKSVLMHEEGVRLTPTDHPGRPVSLNGLASSLCHRFERFGDLTDLKRSILVQEDAIRLTPDDHPSKVSQQTDLGDAYWMYFEHSHNPSNLSAAILHFSEASRVSSGPTSIRFDAARRWISSARLQGDSQAILDACATTIDLLPQLAWIGLPLAERHRRLLRSAHIVRDAAAAAVDAGHPNMAVEWLEQGRSIVWSQILQLRTPVDELRAEHPTLARQFKQISRELEHAGSRDHAMFSSFRNNLSADVTSSRSLETVVQKHHDLALRREKLISEIRSLPGFDRFLLPRTVAQLASIASSGPVVYLNASKQRCDALIVKAGVRDAILVPLPRICFYELVYFHCLFHVSLTQERLISREDISKLVPSDKDFPVEQFLDSLLAEDSSIVEDVDRAVRIKPQRTAGYTPDHLFRKTLAHLWNNVVYPVLEVLGFLTPRPSSEKKGRIFWCPTGSFVFLPIHAAGIYGMDGTGPKLSDFAISSYIPTLSALAPSIQQDTNPSPHIQLVAVPQPTTDGLSGLTCVKEEIDHIRTLSASSPFVTFEESSDGTVEDVLERMKHADWVHFACHGVQDPEDPLNSGLCLADRRRLKLSDIIRLSRPQGGLAFLSACQTAQGNMELAEESVHVAAGMLLAGYGGVIATMWAIRDPDAPKVAKEVYGYLFRDGKAPDGTEAAEALHDAVQRLRDSGASFTAWVPFIHVGR